MILDHVHILLLLFMIGFHNAFVNGTVNCVNRQCFLSESVDGNIDDGIFRNSTTYIPSFSLSLSHFKSYCCHQIKDEQMFLEINSKMPLFQNLICFRCSTLIEILIYVIWKHCMVLQFTLCHNSFENMVVNYDIFHMRTNIHIIYIFLT